MYKFTTQKEYYTRHKRFLWWAISAQNDSRKGNRQQAAKDHAWLDLHRSAKGWAKIQFAISKGQQNAMHTQ
jgi:hypothetical protein